jgi:hypothetical protein
MMQDLSAGREHFGVNADAIAPVLSGCTGACPLSLGARAGASREVTGILGRSLRVCSACSRTGRLARSVARGQMFASSTPSDAKRPDIHRRRGGVPANLSRGIAYQHVRDGVIPAERVGRRWPVPRKRFRVPA